MKKNKIKNDNNDLKNINSRNLKGRTMKDVKVRTETEDEIRRFIIILVVVMVLIVGVYFLSQLIVNKREEDNTTTNTTTAKIDYDMASVGTILNRPYDSYYVMIYDSEDNNAMYYSSVLTKYQKTNKGKIYYVDLGNDLNKKYKSNEETGNKDAKSIDDFSFGNVTLLKITNSNVTNYYEGIDKIKEVLES